MSVQKKAVWKAHLRCDFERGVNRTVVRRSHTGPLAIQRPFYPEDDVAHVYILHPPGGVVGGDQLTMDIRCGEGASGLLTTPGATKYYRSNGQCAHVSQLLSCSGGSLEWFPQENILFSGAEVDIRTSINLQETAAVAWWDVNCFGRDVGGEPFKSGAVTNTVNLFIDNHVVWRDRTIVSNEFPLSMQTGHRTFTVSGTLLLCPVEAHALSRVQAMIVDNNAMSVTCFDSLLIARYLGHSAEDAKAAFTEIWSALRPTLNKRGPTAPRIWST